MRLLANFGTVLVMALASCSGSGGDAKSNGKALTQSARSNPAALPAASTASAKGARLAALPDRGALLHYDAQAPVREGAYTWHRTELSERHALDAIATGTLRITTPAGRVLGFEYDRSIRHDDTGDWTWIGHLPGQEGVQAILTFGAGAVYGSIGQPDTRPLRLTMRGGASWLVETDSKQLAGLASHAANPVSPDYKLVSPAAMKRVLALKPSTGAPSAALAPTAVSAAATVTTVDLVIGYTQGFVTAQGSTANVMTRLNSLVDTANAGLVNSKVAGRIRLVHALQVNYTDTNSNETALDQLTGTDGENDIPVNAAFNALRAARETYGADLVSLVRPFREPEQDSCGIAWLVGGGKQQVTSNNGWDPFGYSVVSDGADKNEQDGKTYFCEEHTLAHELGHNMGSQHDRETAKGDDGVLDNPDDYGAFAYSFGYKPTTAGKNFYTIMAYGDSGQTSYLTFSNPRTTFCGGNACGVNNSEDNAKSLGQVMPAVAGFRATVAGDGTVPAARHIDANGNGKSDLFFFNHSTGALVTWYMDSTTRTAYSTSFLSGAYHVVGSGNFSDDQRDDLFFAGSDGKLYLGTSNGSTFTVQTLPYTISSEAVATGDFNGNGKSDILLLNSSTGQLVTWFMNNNTRTAYTSQTVPVGLRFVTAGDFNGDGMDDLLFEGAQGSIYIAISFGTVFQMHEAGLSHSSDYSMRGVCDVNGDGRADILLHSATLNKLVVWYMDGRTRTTYTSSASPVGATLVATGDFDHNGKDDLGWVHSTSGQIWLSLSAGHSFTTSLLPYTYQPSMSNAMDIDL